jgi:hypothetical protein
MAVTSAIADAGARGYYIEGAQKKTVRDFTFTGTYAANGVAWTATNLGLNHVDHGSAQIKTPVSNQASEGLFVDFVRTSGVAGFLKLYDHNQTEITAGDTISTMVVRVTAYGS